MERSGLNMKYFFFIFCVENIEMLSLPVYDFIGTGTVPKKKFGDNTTVLDSAILANDSIGNLPYDFTICSSVFIRFFLSRVFFIQVYKEDGSIWFNYFLLDQDIKASIRDSGTYTGYILFNGTALKFNGEIKIQPHSWFHGCIALDTETKKLNLVVNGNHIYGTVLEKELAFLKTDKPTSLKVNNSILLLRFSSSFYYQSEKVRPWLIGNLRMWKRG